MSLELVRKFHYGANVPPDAIVAGAFPTRGTVSRQTQLVNLTKAGLADQLHTASSLENSFAEAANEVRWQTKQVFQTLEKGISRHGEDLYELQNTLRVELAEIRWMLWEQNQVLGQMLETLRKRRSAEATELVEQGLRNFRTGFYQEAVDRLSLALLHDNTDFEAYMNLGFAYIHMGNGALAAGSFHKAAVFAPTDRPLAKAEALFCLGRTHYCLDEFGQAAGCCEEIVGFSDSIPQCVVARAYYLNAIYSAKTGAINPPLEALKTAIALSDKYVSLAVTDNDWGSRLAEVQQIVGALARSRVGEARRKFAEVRALFERTKNGLAGEDISEVTGHLNSAEYLLESNRACYSTASNVLSNVPWVKNLITGLQDQRRLEPRACELRAEVDKLTKELSELRELRAVRQTQRSKVKKWTGNTLRIVLALAGYYFWVVGFVSYIGLARAGPRDASVVFTSVLFVLAGIPMPWFVARLIVKVLMKVIPTGVKDLDEKIAALERVHEVRRAELDPLESRLVQMKASRGMIKHELRWVAAD